MPVPMNRVMIIGNSGGGKTTLAHQVAETYDLPLTEIDAIQYQAGWARTAEPALRQAIETVHERDRWLIGSLLVRPLRNRSTATNISLFW